MDLVEKIKIIQNNLSIKNFNAAVVGAKKILKKFPKNSFTLNLCGLALQGNGDYLSSINYFEKAIFYEQNNIAAMNNLATSYKNLVEYEKAEKLYQQILKLNPNYIQALHNYANFKKIFMRYDEAIILFNQALEKDPKNNLIKYNLATTYQGLGNYKEAKKNILEILKDNPKFIIAHKVLSELIEYKSKDDHIIQMEKLIKDVNINQNLKIDLYFALGKAYEDIKEYSNSFKYLKKGNEIKRKNLNYNIKEELKSFADIMRVFNKIDFEKQAFSNTEHKNIIFICGMPRSGTTLVEQIISTHKNVYGAGELIYLSESIKRNLIETNNLNNYFKLNIDKIFNELKNKSNELEKFYNYQLENHHINSNYITDKAPQNFRWIGIMKLFFPNCKVIHCVRNAKDNCLSLYKNSFPSNAMHWTFDEEDIGNYYNGYKELMSFWKNKIPNFVYDLNYENLVKNKDEEIKKLIKYCDLDWDSNCLEFYDKSNTPIKTVSINQARKPIYSKSINSSNFYSNHLSTLFKIIDKS